MDVCPWPPHVVLSCAGRGIATGWSFGQGVLTHVVKYVSETELTDDDFSLSSIKTVVCARLRCLSDLKKNTV
jgi:hypothetical protein